MAFIDPCRNGFFKLALRPMAYTKKRILLNSSSHPKMSLQTIRSTSTLQEESTFSIINQTVTVNGTSYPSDDWTNVTPKIMSQLERRLHLRPEHPLGLIKARIVDFMYSKYKNHRGNPLFSVHDNLNPGMIKYKSYYSTSGCPITGDSRVEIHQVSWQNPY